ncbi:tail fiber assembly protein [Pseudomonas aeruginosa]|uniref:tail fiber assembly protein n=1 Tax=Pseudomonas aeruginosa TaxID=287 RepID=UPI00208ECC4F
MSFLRDIKTAAELEAERLESLASAARAKRDAMIKETDFYMLPDYPAVPTGVAEYRQALRDITEQPGFPHSIDWPVLNAD